MTGMALALILPAALEAQTRSLTWTETSRMEAPGSLGLILRMAGGGGTSENALHLQGKALIQEAEDIAFIADLDAGVWTSIDHDERTYTTLTIDEMRQLSERMIAAAKSSVENQASAAELEQSRQEAQAEFEFRISSETTGRTERIGSNNATQHFVIGEVEVTATPEGVEETPEGGTFYFLTELWQTQDVPEEREIYDAWAQAVASDPATRQMVEEMGAAAAESGAAIAMALTAWDPKVGAGLSEVAEATEDLRGTTVRSIMTVAIVPLGAEVDREALQAWQPSSMGSALGGAAAGAVAEAARGALRGLGGGLFGGRGRDPEPEPQAAAPSTQALFRATVTRENIAYRESSDDVLGALRTRIADYRVITYDDLVRELPQ